MLLSKLNKARKPYPKENLHELFEKQVLNTPNNIAVEFENKKLTYAELNKQSNEVTCCLISLGVVPGTLIGIFMDRSLEMVSSIIGVLKAGAAYVPIDPMYPQERIMFMLEDSQVPIVLTQEYLKGVIKSYEGNLVTLDAMEDFSIEAQMFKSKIVAGDAPAYVIYTSGSTGTPKGVIIPHRAITNHMYWMQQKFPLDGGDIVLQNTSFSFDASVWEFYAPLLAGARLRMAQPGRHFDTNSLINMITSHGITTIQLVPSVLKILLEIEEFKSCKSLRHVYCGGEVLTLGLQEKFFDSLKASLINLYGPTETCIDATFWVCKENDTRKVVPIGFPVDNLQIYVLDENLEPVPKGISG